MRKTGGGGRGTQREVEDDERRWKGVRASEQETGMAR